MAEDAETDAVYMDHIEPGAHDEKKNKVADEVRRGMIVIINDDVQQKR